MAVTPTATLSGVCAAGGIERSPSAIRARPSGEGPIADGIQAFTQKAKGTFDALRAASAMRDGEIDAVHKGIAALDAERVAALSSMIEQMDAFSTEMTTRFAAMAARIDAFVPRIQAVVNRANQARRQTDDWSASQRGKY